MAGEPRIYLMRNDLSPMQDVNRWCGCRVVGKITEHMSIDAHGDDARHLVRTSLSFHCWCPRPNPRMNRWKWSWPCSISVAQAEAIAAFVSSPLVLASRRNAKAAFR